MYEITMNPFTLNSSCIPYINGIDPYNHYLWYNEDDHLLKEFTYPGASKSDISIKIKKELNGSDKLVVTFEGNKFIGKDTTELPLYSKTKAKDIDAKLEKGVLTIKVKKPKDQEEEIEIK